MSLLDCFNETSGNGSGNGSGVGAGDEEVTDEAAKFLAGQVKHYVMDIGIPVVSGLGLLGNFLTLVVLTKEKLHRSLTKMEISAHIGLIALAVSDLLFCLFVLFVTVLPLKKIYEMDDVLVYFELVAGGLITVFIITSTWLIVVMAAERYVAVCHPLKARNLISLRRTRAYVMALFILCPLCTIPVFLEKRVDIVECWDGRLVKRVIKAPPENVGMRRIVWAVCFDFVPCAALIWFNACLIWKIHKAKKLRQEMAPHRGGSKSMHANPSTVRRFRWDRSNAHSPVHAGPRADDSVKSLVGSRHSRVLQDVDSSNSNDRSHSGANSVELHPREKQLCKQNGAMATTLVKSRGTVLCQNYHNGSFYNGARRSPTQCYGGSSSQKLHRGRRFSDGALNSVTATLVAVVLTFLILVSPWELVKFGLQSSQGPNSSVDKYKVDIALYLTNFLQVLNFSFNFVLYCMVNRSFRNTLYNIITFSECQS